MPYLKSFQSHTPGLAIPESGPNIIVDALTRADYLVTSVNGYPHDHPFEAAHGQFSGCIMNGKLGAIKKFIDCPAAFVDATPFYNGLVNPRATVTSLLAATNPSRPDVLLPVFWAELRDLPDMLRQVGRIAKRIYFERGSWANLIRPGHVTKDMAAANLAIQFGWLPFVKDLWKIATLQDSVEKRRKELNRLYSSKGLKRRLGLGSVSSMSTGSTQVWSTHSIGATVPTRTVHQLESWGTARWKPNALPPWKPTDGELRRYLSGFSPDHILLNLWEGLPWSWLVDWFIPIGQTIQAGNRTVAVPVSACIMQRRTTTTYYDARVIKSGPNDWYITSGIKKSWIHHRAVQGDTIPGYSASFPTLGARQLSILGSLYVLRNR